MPRTTDASPRSYGEMPDEQFTDATYAVDSTYASLCIVRDAYHRRIREGRTLADPLLRDTLDSVCVLANRDLERVQAAKAEREAWAKHEAAE